MTPGHAVRIGMMMGVLLFGGVSWFAHRSPDWTPSSAALVAQLISLARIVWIILGLALVVLFLKGRNASTIARASSVSVIAWSLGETLALYGGVIFYLSAITTWYVAGVMALAITFVAFPPPTPR